MVRVSSPRVPDVAREFVLAGHAVGRGECVDVWAMLDGDLFHARVQFAEGGTAADDLAGVECALSAVWSALWERAALA